MTVSTSDAHGPALAHHAIVATAGPDRPWLVMVHGATQHSGVFDRQVAAFRDAFRLLLVDLPGHGGSAHLAGPYGQAEYADAVRAVLDHVGVDAMHVWGTHTGAAIGLLLAADDPGRRIRSLILDGVVVPGIDLPSVTRHYGRARVTARTRGIEAARREWFDEAEWFDVIRTRPAECRAAAHRAMIDAFDGAPWLDTSTPRVISGFEERLATIDVPVLLVNGEDDLPDFRATAEGVARRLPGAEQYVVPGAGGFPLWEFPDAVNTRVAAFLDRPDIRVN